MQAKSPLFETKLAREGTSGSCPSGTLSRMLNDRDSTMKASSSALLALFDMACNFVYSSNGVLRPPQGVSLGYGSHATIILQECFANE